MKYFFRIELEVPKEAESYYNYEQLRAMIERAGKNVIAHYDPQAKLVTLTVEIDNDRLDVHH